MSTKTLAKKPFVFWGFILTDYRAADQNKQRQDGSFPFFPAKKKKKKIQEKKKDFYQKNLLTRFWEILQHCLNVHGTPLASNWQCMSNTAEKEFSLENFVCIFLSATG